MKQVSQGIVACLRALIWCYQVAISPFLGRNCRFEPSCSAYASEALVKHGPVLGLGLTVHRLCRCHPWGGVGYDPVPEKIRLWPRSGTADHRGTAGSPN